MNLTIVFTEYWYNYTILPGSVMFEDENPEAAMAARLQYNASR